MTEKLNFNRKNVGQASSSQKGSLENKNNSGNHPRPAFKPISVLEQVKIVTRLIEYLETR